MELIPENSVMMLTTGVTAATRVRSVLTDTTMTGRHVTSLLSVLMQSGRLQHMITKEHKLVHCFIHCITHSLNH